MAKKALIVWGGWDGHQPQQVANLFATLLDDFEVEIADNLDAFKRASSFDLIVPVWTMGEIDREQLMPVVEAVESGVGIAGCHGGMCDSFRNACEWQFVTGGQWVAHPGNETVTYKVEFRGEHEITNGLPNFEVTSEQYYMHTDPSNQVLATTRFPTAAGPHTPNGPFDMPVVWTRLYGKGKVFYCSLGHQEKDVAAEPVRELMRRGLHWAAR